MAIQVKKDVDGVGADLLGQRAVGDSLNCTPGVGGGPEPRRKVVLIWPRGVTSDLTVLGPQGLQDPQRSVAHGMAPEIGRDKTQSQGTVAVPRVGTRPPPGFQGSGMPSIIRGIGRRQFSRARVAGAFQCNHEIVMGPSKIRLDPDRRR